MAYQIGDVVSFSGTPVSQDGRGSMKGIVTGKFMTSTLFEVEIMWVPSGDVPDWDKVGKKVVCQAQDLFLAVVSPKR